MANAVRNISGQADGSITAYTSECGMCGKPGKVENIPAAGFAAWAYGRGDMIQNALPALSPGEREMLLTGLHSECFDKMCPPEDD